MLGKFLTLVLEQIKFRKAMNNLAKLEWSTDYIIYLLRKAQIRGLSVQIHEPGGRTLVISADSAPQQNYVRQEGQLSQDEWDQMLGLGE
jgi:hypothetical protein